MSSVINNNNMSLLQTDSKFKKYFFEEENSNSNSSTIKNVLNTKAQLEQHYNIATNLREVKLDVEKFDPLYIHTNYKNNYNVIDTYLDRYIKENLTIGKRFYMSKKSRNGELSSKGRKTLRRINLYREYTKLEINTIKLFILHGLFSNDTFLTNAELKAMPTEYDENGNEIVAVKQSYNQSMHLNDINAFYEKHPELRKYKCFILTMDNLAVFIGTSHSKAKSVIKTITKKGFVHNVSHKKYRVDSENMPCSTRTVYLIDIESALKYVLNTYGIYLDAGNNLDESQYNAFKYAITQYHLLKVQYLIRTKTLNEKMLEKYQNLEAKLIKVEKTELNKLLKEIVFAIDASKRVLPIIDWAKDFFGEDLVDIKYVYDGRTRCYNAICGTRNDVTNNKRHNLKSKRVEKLQQFLCTDAYTFDEYDINGSIYRLSYSIGHYFNSYKKDSCHDYILPYNTDVYFEIYKACNYPGIFGSKHIDKKTFAEKIRPLFKTLCMPIYMHEGCATERAIQFDRNVEIEQKYQMSLLFNSNKDMQNHFNTKLLLQLLGIKSKTLFIQLRKGLHEFLELHTFERSKVFVYESIVLLYMLYEFNVNLGIRTINAYDCFYFDKKDKVTQQLFDKVHEQCVRRVIVELECDGIFTTELYSLKHLTKFQEAQEKRKLKTITKPSRKVFNYKKDITDYHISICPKLEPLRYVYDKMCNDVNFMKDVAIKEFIQYHKKPTERVEMSAKAIQRIKAQRTYCNLITSIENISKKQHFANIFKKVFSNLSQHKLYKFNIFSQKLRYKFSLDNLNV